MKVKFDSLFRGLILCLLLTLSWGLWAGAQPTTNSASVAATNKPSALVRSVEQLDQHYLTFGLDRIALLRESTLLGQPLWKYLASLIYVLLAFYVSRFIDLVTRVWLKKLAASTETKLDDLLLELLKGPIKVVAFVLLLNLGLNIFQWPETVKSYLSKGLIVVVAGALAYLAVKVINLLLEVWRRRTGHEGDRAFNEQLFSFIRKSLDAFIIVVAVLSIGGLAVGLAAQDTLANLFGAVALFADKPFREGDQIKLDGAEGVVEAIGLRSTRVRHPEGHLVAVPNKTMGNAIITNLTKRSSIKTVMNLVLAHDLTTEKVKRALELLREIYRSHSMTQDVWISFNQFAGRSLNLMIVHWWKGTDYQKYLAGIQELNLTIKERFDAEGITFA